MMKGSICLFAVSVFSALVLTSDDGMARDNDATPTPLIVAAAQVSKPKQINACRARYRDCLKLNQIPAFECQYIYEDCTHRIY
jgi:hypothetical protein